MRNALGPGVDQVEGRAEALTAGWTRVLNRYGMEVMGPWAGLALATGGIAATAYASNEETRGRLARFVDWSKRKCVGAWLWWRDRRASRRIGAEAREERMAA
ncbi:MAG: hypothetical protein H0W38_13005 [Methylibium sp.]|nr:hypothetical protein [Methylibium sp.]